MQRLRVRFARGGGVRFISHLDIMRMWERVLRRAQIPLALTEGFNPHPRFSLAAPLPVGVTSEAELMDIVMKRWLSPQGFTSAVSQQLPQGFEMLGVFPVLLSAPSLQSRIRFAEYRVEVAADKEAPGIEEAILRLLALESLPWHHQRDTGQRNYDIRKLIDDMWAIESCNEACTIGMRLRCDSGGSGRPEQVVAALGLPGHPLAVHRTKLIFEGS